MIRIEEIDDLPYEEMSEEILDSGDKAVWDTSIKKIAVFDDDQLIAYGGAMETDRGIYIWAALTQYFKDHPQIGIRYGLRVMNYYFQKGYSPMWCLVKRDDPEAQRLIRLAGFRFADGPFPTANGFCNMYRRV